MTHGDRDPMQLGALSIASQGAHGLHWVERELNGLPALLVMRGDQVQAAILLAVEESRICGVFMQADPSRLARLSGALRT